MKTHHRIAGILSAAVIASVVHYCRAEGPRTHEEALEEAEGQRMWEGGPASPVAPTEAMPDCWERGEVWEGETTVCEHWHLSACAIDSGRASRVALVCDDYGAEEPMFTRFVTVGGYGIVAY